MVERLCQPTVKLQKNPIKNFHTNSDRIIKGDGQAHLYFAKLFSSVSLNNSHQQMCFLWWAVLIEIAYEVRLAKNKIQLWKNMISLDDVRQLLLPCPTRNQAIYFIRYAWFFFDKSSFPDSNREDAERAKLQQSKFRVGPSQHEPEYSDDRAENM